MKTVTSRTLALSLGLLWSATALAQTPANPYSYSRSSSFEYAVNGLLSAEIVEPDNIASCVRTVYGRDAYGNQTSATTSNCPNGTVPARQQFATRTTSTNYAPATPQVVVVAGVSVTVPQGLFPITATNATLSQSETKKYDPRFGAVTELTGPNSLTTQWSVDDFGRVVQETRADGTHTVSYYCYLASSGLDMSSNTPGCPAPAASEIPADAVYFVHTEPRNTSNAKMGAFTRVYSDRRGRTLRSVTESFDGPNQPAGPGALIVKDAQYNAYGAKIIETQAYFLAINSSTTTGSGDYGLSFTNYDALGRPYEVFVADPNGSLPSVNFGSRGSRKASVTRTAFAGLVTTVTNDKGYQQKQEKNVDGQVVRVTDHTGAQTVRQYDAFGNLVRTRDALQNVITTTFDIRGRKTQLNDPDSGLWMYDYDALGQLVWQQSPNQRALSQQTTMAYDVLGRMVQRVAPEYTSTWSYDKYANSSACNKGVGKLCEVTATNGFSRKHVYDSLGRPSSSRTTITSGPSFATAVTYDAATGRIATQSYPTGLKVAYSYTTKGFVDKLTLATAASVTPPAVPGGMPPPSVNLPAGSLLWQAQVVNAWGSAERSIRGNSVVSRAAFEASTGRTTTLTAGIGTATNVLNYTYAWDSLNNLKTRADANGDGAGAVTETYNYDTINRLVDYTVASAAISGLSRKVTLQYNAIGNLLYKSDFGIYDTTGTRPHAVVSTTGASTVNYTFDANGNVTAASGGKYRSIAYTSFNMPDSQTGAAGAAGTPRYLWQYDADFQRIKETRTNIDGTRVTWMMHPNNTGGLSFESEENTPALDTPTISNRHYLAVGSETVGVLVSMGALPVLASGVTTPPAIASITLVKVEYWHRDHLGSLATTTDHTGAVTARYAYDPFGQRRYANGVYDLNGALVADWSPNSASGTDRGFTGHEHLDDIGLIHMNGRLYDPRLARFLQADPFIQDIDNLQAFNRYAYCANNPLNCTDPSGYFSWKKFWKNVRPIVAIVVAILLAPETGGGSLTATGVFASLGEAGVVTQIAVAGFASGAIASGTVKGGVQGAVFAVAFFGVGSTFGNFDFSAVAADPGKFAASVAAHGIVGCAQSVVGGGKCAPGALSAAFSKLATPVTGPLASTRSWEGVVAGTVVSAVIGGTAAELGGGKFANGAQTAAFGYLFNQLQSSKEGELIPAKPTPEMEAARDRLSTWAAEAAATVDNDCSWTCRLPWIRGSRIHAELARIVRESGGPYGFRAEISYQNGVVVDYGSKGSIRADVVVGSLAKPLIVFDLKTGFFDQLGYSEAKNYGANLPRGTPFMSFVPKAHNE